MDNREDDNRPQDEATPADTGSDNDVERSEPALDLEKSDPAMSDQLDLEATPLADDMQADTDADTEDDANPEDEEPGKDWLVDTGLAAAINPQTEADGQISDDDETEDTADDEDSDGEEDEDALWSDDDDVDGEDEDDDDGDHTGDDDEDDEDDEDEDDEDEDDDGEDEDDDEDDEDDFEDDETALDAQSSMPPPIERRSAWPMLVGGVALVLIGFGGWDLYQERATLQARVVELEQNQSRAKQAVEVDAKTLAALEADNAALTLQLDNLYRDYDTAMAELAKLQSDAEAVADRREESGANLDDEATTASESEDSGPVELESLSPASTAPISDESVAGSPGDWFVNIGAYASEQSAENWSLRLQNSGYDVVVQEIQTAEGKTLTRVRLTGFGSKAAAQSVATELEADFGTGPLWVGQLSE
ncbi:MAG: SPOR domain-containing protein [Halieaceae bacterium]